MIIMTSTIMLDFVWEYISGTIYLHWRHLVGIISELQYKSVTDAKITLKATKAEGIKGQSNYQVREEREKGK